MRRPWRNGMQISPAVEADVSNDRATTSLLVLPGDSPSGAYDLVALYMGADTFYVSPGSSSLTVVPLVASLSFQASSLEQVYDGNSRRQHVSTSTNPGDLTVSYTFRQNNIVVEPINAGAYEVIATVVTPNYQASATGVLTIKKADASVTFDPATLIQTYTGASKTVAWTTSPAGLAVNVTYSPANTTNAGSYTVTTNIADPNYSGGKNATLTVNKANQTITFAALSNKKFGDFDFMVNASASSGLGVSFSVTGPAEIVSGTTNKIRLLGAGVVTVRASQGGDVNRNAATPIDQSFTVAKATPTVTVIGGTFTYDGVSHGAASGSVTGVGGANLGTPTYRYFVGAGTGGTELPGPPVNAGSYTVLASFAGDANYTSKDKTAAILINKRLASVMPKPAQKVYGDVDPSLAGELVGFLSADLISATYQRTNGESVSGSPYTISAILGPAAVLSNYDIFGNTAGFAILPAPLSVWADNLTKALNGALPPLTYRHSPLKNGDSEGVFTGTLNTTAQVASSEGQYPITRGTLSAGSNYEITFAGATMTIEGSPADKRAPQVTSFKTTKKGNNLATIVVTYSETMDPKGVKSLNSYRLITAGRDMKFGTKDDQALALGKVGYDQAKRLATLTTRKSTALNQPLQLVIRGSALSDVAGNFLDGDKDGRPGGDYVARFGTKPKQ